MSFTAEQLYRLLPALYRIRDAEQGEPLKALIKVIADQAGVLDEDISRLYRNWFIETSDEWVVPYIGDLLGIKNVHPVSKSTYSLRAFVANTLRYRRRKGTATVLEQLARDITGWNARAVEFFQLLGTTQYINHIRLDNHRTPDLRRGNVLELLDTPFDTIAHTADVRHIKSGRGKHNIPNIGLFLWRLQAFPIYRAMAYSHAEGKFSFSPLGNDIPLFNHPITETMITHLAEEINVPGLLRRRLLYDELEARRQALVDNRTPEYVYFDDRKDSKAKPVLEIFLNGSPHPVHSEEVMICNLSKWDVPPDKKTYERTQEDGSLAKVDMPITVAVDPELGRLSFPAGVQPEPGKVEVKYYYGFSSEVGGGCYPRSSTFKKTGENPYIIGGNNPEYLTLQSAYEAWTGPGSDPQKSDILEINDSQTHNIDSLNITIPAGKTLEIRAGDEEFPLLKIKDSFTVKGETGSRLILNGLRICGEPLIIEDGDLGTLELRHCTLVPGIDFKIVNGKSLPAEPNQASLTVDAGNSDLNIAIERSICGGFSLLDTHDLEIRDSVIQGLEAKAINGSNLTVEASTILGAVTARIIELASNTIFTDTVEAELTQQGCVRFSYVPEGSQVPRRYRCQPDLAIKEATDKALKIKSPLPDGEKEQIEKSIRAWLQPTFADEDYGEPGYAQLSLNCPKEICEGAEDGAEMGVFHHLLHPQKVGNLWASLDEYLPANMKAGIFFVN